MLVKIEKMQSLIFFSVDIITINCKSFPKGYKLQKIEKFQYKELKRLHKVFVHPNTEKVKKLLKNAGNEDTNVNKKLDKIEKNCKIGRKLLIMGRSFPIKRLQLWSKGWISS